MKNILNKQTKASRRSSSSLYAVSMTISLIGCLSSCKSGKSILNHSDTGRWIGTWSTAVQLVEPNNMPPAPGLTDGTLRQVVRVSAGGERIRLRISNIFGNRNMSVKAATIAYSTTYSGINIESQKSLTFQGKPDATIHVNQETFSDALDFHLIPGQLLAITIYYGAMPENLTGHPGSRTTSYLLRGNQVSSPDFKGAEKTDHWYTISGIEVLSKGKAASIAALGNSITDGRGSGTNKQNRWTDVLSKRLLADSSTAHYGMLNLGIGGNCVLHGGLGPTALDRFDRDILSQNGVKWLLILEGINDIGGIKKEEDASRLATDLINAYTLMIDKAHSKGIKVYGCTILPFAKSGYDTPYRQAARDMVNDWIRNSGKYDAVIDFARIMADPMDPRSILPGLHTGDFLHPNEAGYQKMGEAINLSLFK